MPEYLETMLAKMAKEMPGVAGKEGAASQDTEEVGAGLFFAWWFWRWW